MAMILPSRGIDTKLRLAGFLAQCGHESNDLNVLSENLNYSAQGLRKVFPKYFPDDHTAWRYARQPEWIASRVYGGRMGNGGEQTKDGWKYRGRGIIQLTGKNNYLACSTQEFGGMTIVESPDLLLEKTNAIKAAIWFWERNKLNAYCDAGDVKGMTKVVNGGYNGLDHRTEIYNRAISIL